MENTEEIKKTKWVIDHAHSQVAFRVKHMIVGNLNGKFNDYDASIYTVGEDFLSAEVDFWLNTESIDTGNEKRDIHLKSADFFDVVNFKEINFTLNTCENLNEDIKYEVYGDLTMKGIAKQIKLEAEYGGIMKDPLGNTKAFFCVTTKINRKDWNLNWNSELVAGGLLVGEDIWITCDLQLIKITNESM